MANRVLKKPGDDPTEVLVHLSAPTGTAAYNIGGATLHSFFQLPLGQSNIRSSLSSEKLNGLRVTFSKLKILVIDEISMVGATMLANIHERLQAITSLPADIPFGGISIFAVGDLQQLPPVCDPPVFGCAKDPYYALADLWNSNFKMFELKEIMRQKNDERFAQLLSRVRLGNMTENDIILLKSREASNSSLNNDTRLHLYSTNKFVDLHNDKVLNSLSGPLRTLEAIDKLPHTYKGLKIPIDCRNTGSSVFIVY